MQRAPKRNLNERSAGSSCCRSFTRALMLRFFVELRPPKLLAGALGVAILLALVEGCANTCVVGTWNSPNATVGVVAGNPPPACAQPTPKAAVRVVAHFTTTCEGCSESNRLEAVSLNLAGIDIHRTTSEWQKLFPRLETRPLQIKLPVRTNAPLGPIGGTAFVPVGRYDRVRLCFVKDSEAAANASSLEGSGFCGTVGTNCAVWADGHIEPLLIPGQLESGFLSADGLNQPLFLLPEREDELVIELGTSLALSTGDRGGFLPAIIMDARLGRKRVVDRQ